MEKTYEITVFNTLTGRYAKVPVSKEVYQAYMRTEWNIKDNDKSYYAHEIQFSALVGGEGNAYENFAEFIDTKNTPENVIGRKTLIEALRCAVTALNEEEQSIIKAVYFEQQSMRDYSKSTGIPLMTAQDRKVRAVRKLKKMLEYKK